MRHFFSIRFYTGSLVLALCSGAVPAQQSGVPQIAAQQVVAAPLDGCPVRYTAMHSGSGATLRETGSGPVSQYAQTLRLLFAPDVAKTIVRIAGFVHGRDGSLQVVPAQSARFMVRRTSADRTEPFEIARADGGLDGAQYIYTNSIPLITRIELTEIDFKDGSVWSRSAASSCSVAPSLLVLVNASAK